MNDDSRKHYLAVAVLIRTKFFDSLREWFLWNKFIGVDHFYIVDNGCAPSLKDFFKNFAEDITFVSNDINPDHKKVQTLIYKDIYKKYKGDCQWMEFINDDEYIISPLEHSFLDFLKTIESKRGLEINWRLFGPEGWFVHEGREWHKNSFVLDRYKKYYIHRCVKTIINCTKVKEIVDGGCVHRLVSHGAVNCFGEQVEPFTETKKEYCRIIDDERPFSYSNRSQIEHPTFAINHYSLKSWEEVEYKLTERGFAQGESNLTSTPNDPTMYRCKKILKMLFQFTQQNNHLRGQKFDKFFFKKDTPRVREAFSDFFNSQKDKF